MSFDATLTHPQLEITAAVLEQAYQQAQIGSTPAAQWSIYLNSLCLETVLAWLRTEYDATVATAWSATEWLDTWEMVEGAWIMSAIADIPKRLILLSDRTIDTSELRIPQEWVDTTWAGDYFLAIQVNLDEEWLQIWGYITHQQVKAKGRYDASDRAYYLDSLDVIQDFSALWITRQVNPAEVTQGEIPPIAQMNAAEADRWIQSLANSPNPRLALPFSQWTALIQSADHRQQLAQLRRNHTGTSIQSEIANLTTRLSNWLVDQFETGWSAIEQVFPTQLEPAFAFRDSTNSAIRRVKALRFGDRIWLLLVEVEVEPDDRRGIRVQLFPDDRTQCLPTGMTLILKSGEGDTIQTVESRDQDNSIQLRRFRVPAGTPFTIEVQWSEYNVIEQFEA